MQIYSFFFTFNAPKNVLMKDIVYYETCEGSTQDKILNHLSENSGNFTALFTLNQMKGRGQYGNTWENTAFRNVAFTLAVKTSVFHSSVTLINFHTANILRCFVDNLTQKPTKIKWPNDLILNNKKTGGLLIETHRIGEESFYIIGIGLNINQENFEKFPKATSFLRETGKEFDCFEVAENLFSFLKIQFSKETADEAILKEFNLRLFRRNEVAVFQKKGLRQNGIIKEVDAEGFLWIDLEKDGLQKFFHKEIEMLY